MTIDSVEFRKMQYARELAAYTLRQWVLMCGAPENKRRFATASANAPVSRPQPNSRTRSVSRVRDGTGTGTGTGTGQLFL
ncbi:hypothetical protein BJV78DRAFT_1281503 [Lactifluus subvellereus]|nr:hypothetical protein BJV78DRAFT_1281503 [Lactifluus subvellereus]